MGIVKISDPLHEATKQIAKAMHRSINAQAEYWMCIGKIVEENPSMTYPQVLKHLLSQSTQDDISHVSENA